jgi:RNA polymerase sigma-70 factor (ECF subfamily)
VNADDFDNSLVELAPAVRRYCARMLGSLFDGDDVAQDALAQAISKRELLRDGAPIKPWLFRIAHNKCVDYLRARSRWTAGVEDPESLPAEPEPTITMAEPAFSRLVQQLPPRQRAMFLLRELFSFSMEEIATALACSADAVKSGLRRARRALQEAEEEPVIPAEEEQLDLIQAYAEHFDAGDWSALLQLLNREVQIDVSTIYCGVGVDKVVNRYFTNYRKFDFPWIVRAARLPSGSCVLSWRLDGAKPELLGVTRFRVEDGLIVQITDYLHDDYMVAAVRNEIDAVGKSVYEPAGKEKTAPVRPAVTPIPGGPEN